VNGDFDHVLGRFEKLHAVGHCGTKWRACCPSHPDRNPSLGLWITAEGNLNCYCHAGRGCTWKSIIEASGTRPEDWFAPELRRAFTDRHRPPRPTVQPEKSYAYCDEHGAILYEVLRYPPGEDGKKSFKQRRPDGKGGWAWDTAGVRLVPYMLPELLARPKHPVFVVEGEKDAEALAALGLVATTSPGGAGKWPLDFGRYFRGRRVVLVPDNDGPGQKHAQAVLGSLTYWGAACVRVLHLFPATGLTGGDVSDWLADPDWEAKDATDEVKRDTLIELVKRCHVWRFCEPSPDAPASPAAKQARAA
jgi:putative DNA primase/helicase